MEEISRLDLQKFLSNNAKEKEQFVQDLGNAFEEIGFVILKGHNITSELTGPLYKQIKAFFDLEDTVKSAYEIEGMAGQRGYTSFGKEHAKDRTAGDLKEFWHFGQYNSHPDPNRVQLPDNILVNELPEFNKLGKKVYQALEQTGTALLKAIALYLKLDENYFEDYVRYGNSILRPIHYPPIKKAPKEAVRAAPHGDINLITLLMGAQGKGLQVKTKSGYWIDAIAQDEDLIINMGDMMARLTNNKLKSTLHQVINPPKALWGTSRYSIPFFMHPIPEMPLNCLENCIDADHPKMYEDCTAGEYLDQRLIELGLKNKP